MQTKFTTTPGTHAEANGHWDVAKITGTVPATPGPGPEVEFASIRFQNGPVKEHGVNGVQLADVLRICLARYELLNDGPFRCRENSIVITRLQEAILWDEERTAQRTKQGVEGFDKPRGA